MKRYIDVMIVQSSDFGEYDVLPTDAEPWDSFDELHGEICRNADGDVIELADDMELPEGVETLHDIRGRIHNEPDRVFAIVGWRAEPDAVPYVTYFGINEVES